MSIEQNWGNFFKAEVKASGRKLFAQEKVSLSNGSETFIQAYVKAAPPVKIQLSTVDVGNESFTADCTCPAAKKSQFCKHIWATLLCVELRYPDFLSLKRFMNKPSVSLEEAIADPRTSLREAAKLRAADYRKEQYQKQKLRAKEIKRQRQGRSALGAGKAFPAEIEDALGYFSKNGFPMPEGPSEAIAGEAKRKLSRVFHPDKGGSTAEMVELIQNCELILRFLQG